jgi:hypothetical protein
MLAGCIYNYLIKQCGGNGGGRDVMGKDRKKKIME